MILICLLFFCSDMLSHIISPHQNSINTPHNQSGATFHNQSGATLNSHVTNQTFQHHVHLHHPPQGSSPQSEKALYVTFFCITTTFLFCHLPRIILNTHEVQMSKDRRTCEEELNRHYFQPSWVIILSYFEKLALIFNCSINFVFYCFASKMFKAQMIKVVFSRLIRMCRIASEVIILADRPSEGHQGMNNILIYRPRDVRFGNNSF